MAHRIGIVGKGNVGSALKKGFERNGHDVRCVGKQPEEVRQLGQWADVLVLAVPFNAREDALRELGDIDGKILVDVTNALDENQGFALQGEESGAQQVQQRAGGARVVKAFNTVFANNMAEGRVNGESLSLLVAGDDDQAKRTVMQMGKELGFDPVDAGPLRNARELEHLGYLNIQLGYSQGMGTDMGLKLVH